MPERRLADLLFRLLVSVCVVVAITIAIAAVTGLPVSLANADDERYAQIERSRGGTGKQYMGREISGIMGWQGAAWLERQEREREERTDLLLRALALTHGMVVADIGAGTGFLSRRMATAVGEAGKVLAVDIQPEMIKLLEASAQKAGLTNIEASLGTVTDVSLPPSSVDLAIMVDVYHELSHPYEVLASIVRSLKPGGQVVFVEYKAEDPKVPIKRLHKMTETQVKREAAVHPLRWMKTVATLPWQHVVIFKKE